ncbi:MAG: 50S ribosomal protein L23 [bacterium]|nr:50S ribosomal protein L23 [bacterium]
MSFLNLRKTKEVTPKPAIRQAHGGEQGRTTKKPVAKDAVGKKSAAPSGKLAVAGSKGFTGTVRPDVLVRPHVTEKASASAEKGVYVFQVALNATKREIMQAVAAFYKVTPTKVTIVTMPVRRITVKGRIGIRAAGKKAYVFLKKGEKIEIN